MKYQRNGKVAALYSPGFGAGWSTWHREHAHVLVFHPLLVEPVDQYEQHLITKEQMVEKVQFGLTMLGLESVYTGGIWELEIFWLPPGTRFRIEEYDGSEAITSLEDEMWMVA